MLSIIPLLLVGSVACMPTFSDIFSIGCTKPIYQDLDSVQGLRPDLRNPANFGYLNRLDTPTLRLGPDISLHHQSEELPHQAASILSSIAYDEFNAKLVIRGSISKLNAYRLNRVPSMEGTIMTVRFDTFGATDKSMWSHLFSSSPGGITGRIESLSVQEKKNGDQELTVELSPEPNLYYNKEYLNYRSRGSMKQIDWTGSGKNGCRTHKQVNSKKDRFHETFESAVLL